MANPRIVLEGDATSLERAARVAELKLKELETAIPHKGFALFNQTLAGLGVTLGAGAFVAAFTNVIRKLDELEEAAQSAGVSVQQLSALRYAASFAGVGADELQKSLGQLNSRLADAAGGSKEAQAVFESMGLKLRNSSGQLLQTDEALASIADRFATYRDGAEKSALAADIFGQKIGPKLIPFLNQGAAGIERLKREAEAMGLVIGDGTASAAAKFADQMDRLSMQIDAARINLGTSLLPFLTKTIEEFNAATKAAGSLTGALYLLAKQSAETLEDPGEKLNKLRDQLAGVQAEQDAFLQRGDKGLAQQLNARIDGIKREIGFLQELQRNRALANTPEGITDQVSRAAGRGGLAAPIVRKGGEAQKPLGGGFGPEFEDLKRIRANRAKMAEEIEEEERKAAERNAAIAKAYVEHWTSAVDQRVSAIQMSFLSDAQLEQARFEEASKALRDKLESDATYEAQYRADKESLEQQHQDRLTQIRDDAARRSLGIQQVYREMDVNATLFALRQIAGLQEVHSKRAFEIGKAAAMAETFITTHSAAQKTYDALASANVYVAAAAAAAVEALGLWRVDQIRRTKFGGSPGSAGSGGLALPSASSATATGGDTVPVQPIAQAPRSQINVTVESDSGLFTERQIRELIQKLADSSAFGADVQVNVTR